MAALLVAFAIIKFNGNVLCHQTEAPAKCSVFAPTDFVPNVHANVLELTAVNCMIPFNVTVAGAIDAIAPRFYVQWNASELELFEKAGEIKRLTLSQSDVSGSYCLTANAVMRMLTTMVPPVVTIAYHPQSNNSLRCTADVRLRTDDLPMTIGTISPSVEAIVCDKVIDEQPMYARFGIFNIGASHNSFENSELESIEDAVNIGIQFTAVSLFFRNGSNLRLPDTIITTNHMLSRDQASASMWRRQIENATVTNHAIVEYKWNAQLLCSLVSQILTPDSTAELTRVVYIVKVWLNFTIRVSSGRTVRHTTFSFMEMQPINVKGVILITNFSATSEVFLNPGFASTTVVVVASSTVAIMVFIAAVVHLVFQRLKWSRGIVRSNNASAIKQLIIGNRSNSVTVGPPVEEEPQVSAAAAHNLDLSFEMYRHHLLSLVPDDCISRTSFGYRHQIFISSDVHASTLDAESQTFQLADTISNDAHSDLHSTSM